MLISVAMLLADSVTSNGSERPITDAVSKQEEVAQEMAITDTIVVDNAVHVEDWSFLQNADAAFANVPIRTQQSVEETIAQIKPTELVMVIDESDDSLRVSALLCKDTELTQDEEQAYADFFAEQMRYALLAQTGLSPVQLQQALLPFYTQDAMNEDKEEQPGDLATMLIEMFLPFMILMLMYFLVLFYGQSVANSVVME